MIRLINSIKFREKISQLPVGSRRIFVLDMPACVLQGRTIGQIEYSICFHGLPFVRNARRVRPPRYITYDREIILYRPPTKRAIRKRIFHVLAKATKREIFYASR